MSVNSTLKRGLDDDVGGTGGGSGTVTSVSVATANGFAGTVATPGTTPAITLTTNLTGLLKGDGTAMSAASAGTDYVAPGGALGTPGSGTLTNCTGLPQAGVVNLTTDLAAKQATLVSGTNIKTINGTSLLGAGDIVTGGGSGTVTSVSVVTLNGFAGTVANAGTTPAITLTTSLTGLLKGNGTAMSAAVAGTDYVAPGGALGTPSGGTLTNCTGLPISTGVSGLAANVAAFLATPSSANMAAMLSDETGTGSNVFGTAPDLTNVKLLGAMYMQQGAQTSLSAAATLTAAQLLTGIIQYTGSAANLTLPTGTSIDAGVLAGLAVDRAFEFVVVNTGSGAATMVTNTGLTTVGSLVVTNGTSARFRVRKTAANTYTVYRV